MHETPEKAIEIVALRLIPPPCENLDYTIPNDRAPS
jgi:hypothetical protein